ncbi:hypothetical protein OIU78_014624, partial [Salix suchowensis]
MRIRVKGGGHTSQIYAIRQSIAKALVVFLPEVCGCAEQEGDKGHTGEDYSVKPADSRRPFRALLDVGLVRITT